MHIVRLQIKNFLSISDVAIEPGKVTQIVGANNQGKTSILKAIEVAMKGTSDASVVKHGESQAEIIVEFSDGLSVRRRVKADGSQDVKVSRNEMEAKAPQSLLNSLFETSAFNPLELLEPKRRMEALLQAVPVKLTEEQVAAALAPAPVAIPPVDFAGHGLKVADQLYDYFYARRSEANKELKDALSRYKIEEGSFNKSPPQKGKADDLELDSIINKTRLEIQRLSENYGKQSAAVDRLAQVQVSISQARNRIEFLKQQLKQAESGLEMFEQEAQALKPAIEGIGPIQEQITELNKRIVDLGADKLHNANYRAWLKQVDYMQSLYNRVAATKKMAEELDRCCNTIKGSLKEQMLDSVEIPVPGLTITNGTFSFEGSSIENLSTSAAMRLAIGLARAMAKQTKVICLDGAEALDEQNYAELQKLIANDGFTYFITKVGAAFAPMGMERVVKMEHGVAV